MASSSITSVSFLLPLQCDDVFSGLSPPRAMPGELKPSQQQDLAAFLRLVGYSVQSGCPGPEDAVSNQKLFSTAYFLVSALAGMDGERKADWRCSEAALLTAVGGGCRQSPPSQQCGEDKEVGG